MARGGPGPWGALGSWGWFGGGAAIALGPLGGKGTMARRRRRSGPRSPQPPPGSSPVPQQSVGRSGGRSSGRSGAPAARSVPPPPGPRSRPPVSNAAARQALLQRRAELRKRRRLKVAFGGWRVLATGAIAAATAWAIASPVWVLRSGADVRVEGNRLIDRDTILRLAALDYPQSLWRIQPDAIAAAIEARAPIAEATVRRELLPPGLTVRVRELVPVAVLQNRPVPLASATGKPPSPLGLIDERGRWIDFERYRSLQPPPPLPPLKVIVDRYSQFQPLWPQLYAQIRLASVPIREIHWRTPNQLELVTDHARIDCGPYGDQFVDQLNAIARLGNLEGRLPPGQAARIDLRDPATPILDLQPLPTPSLSPNPSPSP
jgi:cell division protein FtsQ